MDQLLYDLVENKNARFLTHTVNQIENVKIIVLTAISRYFHYEVEKIFFFLQVLNGILCLLVSILVCFLSVKLFK